MKNETLAVSFSACESVVLQVQAGSALALHLLLISVQLISAYKKTPYEHIKTQYGQVYKVKNLIFTRHYSIFGALGGVPGKWNFQLQCHRQGEVSRKEASTGEGA